MQFSSHFRILQINLRKALHFVLIFVRFTSISQFDTKETPIENMIRLGQLLIADLRLGLETAKNFKQ